MVCFQKIKRKTFDFRLGANLCSNTFQYVMVYVGQYVGVNLLAKRIWTVGPQRDRAITRDLRWEMSATCLCIREWKRFAIHKPNTFAQSGIIQAHTLNRFQHIGNTIICLAKSEKQKNGNNLKKQQNSRIQVPCKVVCQLSLLTLNPVKI